MVQPKSAFFKDEFFSALLVVN
eukprot:SAG11_NODE_19817_length_458_cov_1.206128_1_plen_21_part_10